MEINRKNGGGFGEGKGSLTMEKSRGFGVSSLSREDQELTASRIEDEQDATQIWKKMSRDNKFTPSTIKLKKTFKHAFI